MFHVEHASVSKNAVSGLYETKNRFVGRSLDSAAGTLPHHKHRHNTICFGGVKTPPYKLFFLHDRD